MCTESLYSNINSSKRQAEKTVSNFRVKIKLMFKCQQCISENFAMFLWQIEAQFAV